MVEGTGFENRQARKGLRGSNPLASAFARHSFSVGGLRRRKHVELRRDKSVKTDGPIVPARPPESVRSGAGGYRLGHKQVCTLFMYYRVRKMGNIITA